MMFLLIFISNNYLCTCTCFLSNLLTVLMFILEYLLVLFYLHVRSLFLHALIHTRHGIYFLACMNHKFF